MKPTINATEVWAGSADPANKQKPSQTRVNSGYVFSDKPTHYEINWVFNQTLQYISALNQTGLTSWGSTVNYARGAIVWYNNETYRAVLANTDKVPNVSLEWKLLRSAIDPNSKHLILRPSIISVGDLGLTISSTYDIKTLAFYGMHQGSDWQYATDSVFSNIVHSVSNASLTEYTPPQGALTIGNSYYVRVRYRSDNHLSDWSEDYYMTVTDGIYAPIVTVEGEPESVPSTPMIYGSAYSTSDGSIGAHVSTDWLVEDLTGNQIYFLNSETDLVDTEIPRETLEENTEYRFKVKYHSATNASGYGETNSTTSEVFTDYSEVQELTHLDAPEMDTYGIPDIFGSDFVINEDGSEIYVGDSSWYWTNTWPTFSTSVADIGIIGKFVWDTNSYEGSGSMVAFQGSCGNCDWHAHIGRGMSISSDGTRIIIDASDAHQPFDDRGGVQVRQTTNVVSGLSRRGSGTHEWPSTDVFDQQHFGRGARISGDGDTVAAFKGADERVFIGDYVGDEWSGDINWVYNIQGLNLTSTKHSLKFNYDGTIFAVGHAGGINIYRKDGSWNLSTTIQPQDAQHFGFGNQVYMSDDGNTVITSSRTYDNGSSVYGRIHVFKFIDEAWDEYDVITTPYSTLGGASSINFAYNIAISSDGTRIAATQGYVGTSNHRIISFLDNGTSFDGLGYFDTNTYSQIEMSGDSSTILLKGSGLSVYVYKI